MAKPIEKLGRVSSASVLKGTGKDWDQWISILDRAGARNLTHKEIVALLKKKYKLGPWWQQGVTTGYEIAIGRREEGRNEKGEYSLTATRTFPIDSKKAWKLLMSEDGLAIWLKPLTEFELKPGREFEAEGGVYGEVRTLKTGERFRLKWYDTDWEKPSVVNMAIVPRPNGKSILVFQHEKLQSARVQEQMRERWKSALDELLTAASKR